VNEARSQHYQVTSLFILIKSRHIHTVIHIHTDKSISLITDSAINEKPRSSETSPDYVRRTSPLKQTTQKEHYTLGKSTHLYYYTPSENNSRNLLRQCLRWLLWLIGLLKCRDTLDG
jgi:hypothetical protein